MKKIFFKLLALILGSLFFSCDGTNEYDEVKLLYGIPPTNYSISGTVEDINNVPINGIEINFMGETTLSDPNGEWSIETSGPNSNTGLTLLVYDVDGAENGGVFLPKEVDLLFEDVNIYVIENIEITLDIDESE